jgi:hypothetical protein
MKCPKCRFDNSEEIKFCGAFGTKLEIICPQCNFSNSTEPPPIDYSEPQFYTLKFLADKILTTRSAIEGKRKVVSVLFANVENHKSLISLLNPVWGFLISAGGLPNGPEIQT